MLQDSIGQSSVNSMLTTSIDVHLCDHPPHNCYVVRRRNNKQHNLSSLSNPFLLFLLRKDMYFLMRKIAFRVNPYLFICTIGAFVEFTLKVISSVFPKDLCSSKCLFLSLGRNRGLAWSALEVHGRIKKTTAGILSSHLPMMHFE